MGPQRHGDAHGPQRPHRPSPAGRSGDQSVKLIVADHRIPVGRLDAQIEQG